MRLFWQKKEDGESLVAQIPEGAVRHRLRYTGRVQAVGFRFTAEGWARKCGVTGWVTNLVGGDVALEIQGTPEQVSAFMEEVEHESARPKAFIYAQLVSDEQIEPVSETRFVIRNTNF